MKTVVYRVLSQVLGVILLAVGVFALVAGLYAHGYVSSQLSQEKITMPVAASYKELPQASQDALAPYVGQAMTNGDQAQAYANHYIWEHMQTACTTVKDAQGNSVPAVPADKCTYAGIGAVATASTDATQKAAYTAVRTSNFTGDSLRSMLLTAYAFWLVGSIAFWVGIAALVLGAVLLALAFTVFKDKSATTAAPAAETASAS